MKITRKTAIHIISKLLVLSGPATALINKCSSKSDNAYHISHDRDKLYELAAANLSPLEFPKDDFYEFLRMHRKSGYTYVTKTEIDRHALWTAFLLSTDLFFKDKKSDKIRFVRYYNPHNTACFNPFRTIPS